VHRQSLAAHGANVFRKRHYAHGGKGGTLDAEIGAASTPIDDGTGCDYVGTRRLENFDNLPRAAASGDHVFYDYGVIEWIHSKAPPEDHLAGCVPFREHELRSQRPGDLVADDQSSDRRRHDHVNFPIGRNSLELARQFHAQSFSVGGMRKHQRALEVFRAVETAGKPKVPFQVGAGLGEKI
jgi:hypothetical protein